jgi:transcriptional regulator GlxA family with amidase domain
MSAKIRHQPTQRIGILVFEEFEPIDVWGFVESFAIARFMDQGYSDPSPYPFEIALISNESRPAGVSGSPSPVKSMNGPRVMPDLFREEALGQPFDVLMIPGGWGTRLLLNISSPEAEAAKTGLLQWVREMDARVGIMSSVCTGAAILAASGLLDGKPAATNHEAFAWVASFGPRVLWDNVSRWVDSGHHVTSAGVSAGMDMGFYLVQRLAGRAVAENAVRSAEYEWTNTPRVRPALII